MRLDIDIDTDTILDATERTARDMIDALVEIMDGPDIPTLPEQFVQVMTPYMAFIIDFLVLMLVATAFFLLLLVCDALDENRQERDPE